MQGLAPLERNGVLLLNFKGVPVTLAASAFDLIYLDEEHRVLHGVEISPGSGFDLYNGNAASALILPPKTIARSKTFTGDRLSLDSLSSQDAVKVVPISAAADPPPDIASSETGKAPTHRKRKQRTSVASSAAADSAAKVRGSGSSLKGPGRRDADSSPGATRLIAPIPRDYVPPAPETSQATADLFDPKRSVAPAPRATTPGLPAPVIRDVPLKTEQPLVTHSYPARKVAPSEPDQPPASKPTRDPRQDQPSVHARNTTPGERPEDEQQAGAEIARLSKRALSWLFNPDDKRYRKRRAPRIRDPRLVGYYFAGGPSTPHEIKNLSVMGFYMVTNQRWMPGTIIRVTLQSLDRDGDDTPDSITVLSRVCNWGRDGGGFEFVAPDLEDSA
jgi:hypothetical protein